MLRTTGRYTLSCALLVAWIGCGGRSTNPKVAALETEPTCPGAAPVDTSKDRAARWLLSRAHGASVTAIAAHADGIVATGGKNGTLQYWDLKTRRLLRHLQLDIKTIEGLAWEPGSRRLAVRGTLATLLLDDNGTPVGQLPRASGAGLGHAAIPGTKRRVKFLSNILAIDADGGEPLEDANGEALTSVATWAVSPTGDLAIAIDNSGTMNRYRVIDRPIPEDQLDPVTDPAGQPIQPSGLTRSAGAALGDDANQLVMATNDDKRPVIVIDLSSGGWRALPTDDVFGEALGVDATGELALAVSYDGVCVWRLAGERIWCRDGLDLALGVGPHYNLEEIPVRRPGDEALSGRHTHSAAFSDDGKTVIVGTDAGTVHFIDTATGRLLGGDASHPVGTHALRWNGGRYLATAQDHGVEIWDLERAEVVMRRDIEGVVHDIELRDDGLGVLSIDDEGCHRNETRIIAQKLVAANGWQATRPASRCIPGSSYRGALAARYTANGGDVLVANGDHAATLHRADGTRVEMSDNTVEHASLGRCAFSSDSAYITCRHGVFGIGAGVAWRSSDGQRVAVGQLESQREIGPNMMVKARDGAGLVALGGSPQTFAVAALTNLGVRRLADPAWKQDVSLHGRATAIAVDGSGVVWAGTMSGTLHSVAVDGTRKDYETTGTIVALVPAAGGRLAALTDDGTIQIWDTAAGRLLATLVSFSDEEYIAFTPRGALAGTSEVVDRIGWAFDAPTETFGFEQFPEARNPALVQSRLAGRDVDLASLPSRPARVDSVKARRISAEAIEVTASVTANVRVDRLRVYVDGRPVHTALVCARQQSITLKVPAGGAGSVVGVVAFDHAGAASRVVTAEIQAVANAPAPRVRVVSIGVDQYPHLPASEQLKSAAADAKAIADAFEAQQKAGVFSTFEKRVLPNAQANPQSIDAALAWLAELDADDEAIVLFAGHGFKPSPDADMVFATGGVRGKLGTDKQLELDAASIAKHAIGWQSIAGRLEQVRARTLVLLDACHSGAISRDIVPANNAIAGALSRHGRSGVVVFAAAKGRQDSLEGTGLRRGFGIGASAAAANAGKPADGPGHGLFTAAVIDVLASADADRNDDRRIQLTELIDEVSRRVVHETSGAQTPWVVRRETMTDFAVAGTKGNHRARRKLVFRIPPPVPPSGMGTDPERPVLQCGALASYQYVADYRCPDGSQPLEGDPELGSRARTGNVGKNSGGHVIDVYKVQCPDGERRVHVSMYGCQ